MLARCGGIFALSVVEVWTAPTAARIAAGDVDVALAVDGGAGGRPEPAGFIRAVRGSGGSDNPTVIRAAVAIAATERNVDDAAGQRQGRSLPFDLRIEIGSLACR